MSHLSGNSDSAVGGSRLSATSALFATDYAKGGKYEGMQFKDWIKMQAKQAVRSERRSATAAILGGASQ